MLLGYTYFPSVIQKEQLHSELVAKVEQEKLQREKTEQLNRDITCKNQELENMAKDKSSLEEQVRNGYVLRTAKYYSTL